MTDQRDSQLLEEFRALERQLDGLRARLADQLPRAAGLEDERSRAGEFTGLMDRDEGERNILLCQAAGESVGLLLEDVDRVLPMAALAKLPEAPLWMLGMLNLQGESVPVLDVSMRLNGEPREQQITDLILVTTRQAGRVGLVVPEVHDITTIDASSITRGGGGASQVSYARYLLGMLPLEGRQLYLLDISSLAVMAEGERRSAEPDEPG